MKRPSEADKLAKHRAQAFEYWRNASDAKLKAPSPRFVVLCAFRHFEIWEPGAFPNEPRADFDITELPDRVDALMFLRGGEPTFVDSQEAVTRDAVKLLTSLYHRLGDERRAGPDVLRNFLLQSVWCLFAEDLGLIEGHIFSRIVEQLRKDSSRSSADDLSQLFGWLNRPGPRPEAGLYTGTKYVNGGLFEEPAQVHLDRQELDILALACEYDWRRVEPHIFGSLLQGTLGPDAQHALGAHYTHEVDIQKVIRPTIVEPWLERIENATKLREFRGLQDQLMRFVVLDPACGSGNFLYTAYRELRRIERRLHQREQNMRAQSGAGDQGALAAFFPLTNIKGMEIDGFAVQLARVTLWMGHKLAVDELQLNEATLPLADLSGIQVGDALRKPWPKANAIVGNPPFHGDRNLRSLLGDEYIDWLKNQFGAGVKDHCVYWFRKAHDHLDDGERAGLVGTNSISQNRARSASLNYIVEHGGVITSAVSTQDWPGEAAVDVSIVNWIKLPATSPTRYMLDGAEVVAIDTALEPSTIPIADVPVLAANRGRAFQGFLPAAKYDIDDDVAERLLGLPDAPYRDVVRRYIDGRDIARTVDQAPARWTIDFGQMPLENALQYPAALEIVRTQAKDAREASKSYARNPRWWQYLWPRPELRGAVDGLARYIIGNRVGKRFYWCFADPTWRPSDQVVVVALDSDYAIGILTSRVHSQWAGAKSSTLEDRLRYTPSSAFDTFPWPDVDDRQRARVGEAAREVLSIRSTLCREHQIGLTVLYNRIDDGAYAGLRKAHLELDLAVLSAYGWSSSLLDDVRERNRAIYDRNAEIITGRPYVPF